MVSSRVVVLRRGFIVLVVLGVLAAVAVWSGVSLLRVAEDLTVVRDSLQTGVDLAESGDVAGSAAAFADAERRSSAAVDRVHGPGVSLVGFLPVIGSTVDSVVASTEAADLIAGAGADLLGTLDDLPGGLDALSLGGGGQEGWLDSAALLDQPLQDALAELQLARRLVTDSPSSTTVTRVDDARTTLVTQLDRVVPALEDISGLVSVLPDLFGSDRPMQYFLGAQNPAEMRGTGGLIGAFAILTASEGRVSISPFQPVQNLEQRIFTPETAPSEEFYERYQPLMIDTGTWLNVNSSPDFPAVAETIEAMYEVSEGVRLDGTIVVDPLALQLMLERTGPVDTGDPDIGTIEAGSVVEFLLIDAPIQLGLSGDRKEVLGEAARAVLEAFLGGSVPGRQRLATLAAAGGGGHLLVHSASPSTQEALAGAGVAGGLPDPSDEPFVTLALQNMAESKADFWMQPTMDIDLALNPDGAGVAVVTVTLTNSAPTAAEIPRYILGPGTDMSIGRGESQMLTSMFCGTCSIQSVGYPDVTGFGTQIGEESGSTIATTISRIPPGATTQVRHVVTIQNAWSRAGDSGAFNFTASSAALIRDTAITLSVSAPPGWTFSGGSPSLSATGSRVVAAGADLSIAL